MDSLKAKQESTVKTNLIKGREHEFYDSTLSINTQEMAIDYFRLRYMLYSKQLLWIGGKDVESMSKIGRVGHFHTLHKWRAEVVGVGVSQSHHFCRNRW